MSTLTDTGLGGQRYLPAGPSYLAGPTVGAIGRPRLDARAGKA